MTAGGVPTATDMIDEYYAFQLAHGRVPRNWRDFQYGLQHMARSKARTQLDTARAMRIAQDIKGEEFSKLEDRLIREAGYTLR